MQIATSVIVNHSKLVHTDSPILSLSGPLVPHLQAFPQKALARVTFSTDVTFLTDSLRQQKATHVLPRSPPIVCGGEAERLCRNTNPNSTDAQKYINITPDKYTILTHRNMNITLNKYKCNAKYTLNTFATTQKIVFPEKLDGFAIIPDDNS